MPGVLVASSRRCAVRPLACQGIFVTDCYAQILAHLRKIGPDHALLLAEPVHDGKGEGVDWYAPEACGEGAALPLEALTPEDAAALRARVLSLASDIRAAAEALRARGASRDLLAANMLLLALQHPGPDDIRSLDGRPVVVNWGFASGTSGAVPQDLSRPASPARIAVPAAPAVAEEGRAVVAAVPRGPAPYGCLSWLAPLLLLALLLLLLAGSLWLALFPDAWSLFPEDDATLRAARERTARLQQEADGLRAALLRRAGECRPAPPAPPVPDPAPVTAPPPGPVPAPAPVVPPASEPTPAPASEPAPAPKPVPNEPLAIPEEAREKQDMSFLEGCWRSRTGLYNTQTRQPIVTEYCFDGQGRGYRRVSEKGGAVCKGKARARFESGGRLRMDVEAARCSANRRYVPQRVICTGSRDATVCRGRELGADNNSWDARFTRK